MTGNCKIGFLVAVVTVLLLGSTAKASPTFQDLSIPGDNIYDESSGDIEPLGQGAPVVDPITLQRLFMLLDAIASSGGQSRFRRPEMKNAGNPAYNTVYGGPNARGDRRPTFDLFDSKRMERKSREDKRGSYTPCFFNPVSCFGK